MRNQLFCHRAAAAAGGHIYHAFYYRLWVVIFRTSCVRMRHRRHLNRCWKVNNDIVKAPIKAECMSGCALQWHQYSIMLHKPRSSWSSRSQLSSHLSVRKHSIKGLTSWELEGSRTNKSQRSALYIWDWRVMLSLSDCTYPAISFHTAEAESLQHRDVSSEAWGYLKGRRCFMGWRTQSTGKIKGFMIHWRNNCGGFPFAE